MCENVQGFYGVDGDERPGPCPARIAENRGLPPIENGRKYPLEAPDPAPVCVGGKKNCGIGDVPPLRKQQ